METHGARGGEGPPCWTQPLRPAAQVFSHRRRRCRTFNRTYPLRCRKMFRMSFGDPRYLSSSPRSRPFPASTGASRTSSVPATGHIIWIRRHAAGSFADHRMGRMIHQPCSQQDHAKEHGPAPGAVQRRLGDAAVASKASRRACGSSKSIQIDARSVAQSPSVRSPQSMTPVMRLTWTSTFRGCRPPCSYVGGTLSGVRKASCHVFLDPV